MSQSIMKQMVEAGRTNPFLWTVSNIRLPKNAPWDFEKRKWQIPILNDVAKECIIIKPAQVGMSTITLAKTFWAAYNIPMRVIYTLPREKDVVDMVPTRADPMIQNSPLLQAAASGGADSVRRKVIRGEQGESYVHFQEAGTEPRMLDVDMLVNDEVDLSDQDNLDKYSARLYASPYKIRYQLGTPSVPNYGISSLIQLTDWKVWNVRCPYCGTWVPFDSDWMRLIKQRTRRTYYGYDCCDSCKDYGLSSNDIAEGVWVPQYPGREMSGYQVIRTMDVTMSAGELMMYFKKTRNIANFYNFTLGIPYVAGGVVLDKAGILEMCRDSGLGIMKYGNDSETFYVGIDQGNVLHMVILRERDKEDEGLDLVYAGIFDDSGGTDPFTKAYKVIKQYPRNVVVIDMGPNRYSAISLVKKIRRGWMAQFTTTIMDQKDLFFQANKKRDNIVDIHKHVAIDYLIDRYIRTGHLKFYTVNGQVDPTIESVAEHLSNIQRTIKTRMLFGVGEQGFNFWETTGPDHFVMALVYALTAYNLKKTHKNTSLRMRFLGG